MWSRTNDEALIRAAVPGSLIDPGTDIPLTTSQNQEVMQAVREKEEDSATRLCGGFTQRRVGSSRTIARQIKVLAATPLIQTLKKPLLRPSIKAPCRFNERHSTQPAENTLSRCAKQSVVLLSMLSLRDSR